jgi:OPT family small oligopeptide transporter
MIPSSPTIIGSSATGAAAAQKTTDADPLGIPLHAIQAISSTSNIPGPPLNPTDDEDELDPESDAALLRRHRRDDSSDDEHVATNESSSINLFTRLAAFMSKQPLLMRSSPGLGTGSYGAAPVGTGDTSDEDVDDVRQRKRRKPMTLGLGGGSTSSRTGLLGNSQPSVRMRKSTSRLRRLSTSSADPWPDTPLEGRFGTDGLGLTNTVYESSNNSKENLRSSAEGSGDATDTDEDDANDEEDPPDNSPYSQVRASVSATDNTTLSINTPRMWFMSMLFAILGSSTNLFFSLRYPSVSITPVIALLLVHPLGLLWDQILKRKGDPEDVFVDGSRSSSDSVSSHGLSRFRLWLAQGTWNEKEHTCVYISSNVSFGFAFATDVIVEQTRFYKQDVGIVYQLLLTLSTQILGYTFAGLTRRFLVRPGGMIWPGTLMSAAMFTTLHKEENTVANGWRISRWKFFFVVWACAFSFYFLPGLLFPALSYFSVITWIWPKNVVVANLFGVASGLGLFPVTFDWAQIAYIGSPLLTPFWAAMNVLGGLVIVMWIIAPIAYYNNLFFSSYMPILSSAVFDNTGKVYDVSKILTPDFLFDREAYSKYSRVYLPITYVLSYGLQFAALSSLLTHTALWHGRDIWKQWRRSLKEVEGESKTTYEPLPVPNRSEESISVSTDRRGRRLRRSNSMRSDIISQEDVHNRLMRRYKDAPLTWYLITFVSMTAVGIFVVEQYELFPVLCCVNSVLLIVAAILFTFLGMVYSWPLASAPFCLFQSA